MTCGVCVCVWVGGCVGVGGCIYIYTYICVWDRAGVVDVVASWGV